MSEFATVPVAGTAEPPEGVGFTHRQILLVYSGLMLGMLLAALDQSIVSTALPTIVGELGGLEHLSWVVTAYLLTSTVTVPLYGKLSDLYGRRVLFQTAIVVFLIGSAACGLAQNMVELILFRGVQGLGGGGLFSMALTIIGDVVPPRERGRYQGYMGAVFAFASIAGPSSGGFLTQYLGWRWIFYVNVPIGVLALFVTSANLKLPLHKIPHRIDYEGAALLVAATSAILLGLVWGGNEYPWGSLEVLGLLAGGLALAGLFVAWERRAAEPILPLRLFQNSVFRVAVLLSVAVGFVMFGATIFLPVFLQGAQGVSVGQSGNLILPMMFGIVTMSILSGRVITATGRYKAWPIAGTAVATVGLVLFATMDRTTSRWLSSLYMVLLGAGLGMFMQVLVLAVQNSVPRRDLGAATSGVNFIRSLGSTFGVAIFGSVFASQVKDYLVGHLPSGAASAAGGGAALLSTPEKIRALPPPIRTVVEDAIVHGIHTIFLLGVPIAVGAFVLAFFLKELPLRTGVAPPPSERDARGLAVTFEPTTPVRAPLVLVDEPRPAPARTPLSGRPVERVLANGGDRRPGPPTVGALERQVDRVLDARGLHVREDAPRRPRGRSRPPAGA